jgi:hypothetical protein|tara:strand:+ start:43 stop:294 length:252 start_codon:yes stop_codon:yes gene_type:complete
LKQFGFSRAAGASTSAFLAQFASAIAFHLYEWERFEAEVEALEEEIRRDCAVGFPFSFVQNTHFLFPSPFVLTVQTADDSVPK